MKKPSKRITLLKSLITQPLYDLDTGLHLLKKLGTCKFVESVEAHISLNIDPKYIRDSSKMFENMSDE